MLAAVTSLGMSACSESASPAAPEGDAELQLGQEVYRKSCSSCHGADGGGGAGPKLAGNVAERYPEIADQMAVIANGRGSMPAFGDALSAEEIEAVARYEREVL